jgi:hypothetical protein
MQSARTVLRQASALALCAFDLAACGGGSGSTQPAVPATANSVPASASASVAGLMAWASRLAPDDKSEPLSTESFKPPVDDSAEPSLII